MPARRPAAGRCSAVAGTGAEPSGALLQQPQPQAQARARVRESEIARERERAGSRGRRLSSGGAARKAEGKSHGGPSPTAGRGRGAGVRGENGRGMKLACTTNSGTALTSILSVIQATPAAGGCALTPTAPRCIRVAPLRKAQAPVSHALLMQSDAGDLRREGGRGRLPSRPAPPWRPPILIRYSIHS